MNKVQRADKDGGEKQDKLTIVKDPVIVGPRLLVEQKGVCGRREYRKNSYISSLGYHHHYFIVKP